MITETTLTIDEGILVRDLLDAKARDIVDHVGHYVHAARAFEPGEVFAPLREDPAPYVDQQFARYRACIALSAKIGNDRDDPRLRRAWFDDEVEEAACRAAQADEAAGRPLSPAQEEAYRAAAHRAAMRLP